MSNFDQWADAIRCGVQPEEAARELRLTGDDTRDELIRFWHSHAILACARGDTEAEQTYREEIERLRDG